MLDAPGQMLKFTQIMTQIGASFDQIVQTKNDDQTASGYHYHENVKSAIKRFKDLLK